MHDATCMKKAFNITFHSIFKVGGADPGVPPPPPLGRETVAPDTASVHSQSRVHSFDLLIGSKC